MDTIPAIRFPAILICAVAFLIAAGPAVAAASDAALEPPRNLRIAAGGPQPGARPLEAGGELRISEGDRCPVCAMRPARMPQFAAAIQLKNGATYYFCGTGCMIKSWMHPEIYLGVSTADLDRPAVQEYFTGKPMDAREVTWVAGSDVLGPMGPALVPISGDAALDAFKRRHGGRFIFTLGEMTDARWREITGKPLVNP